ncbi:hypothetical protein CLG_B1070 [Clostridium botulinum D str. 1873]|uniref:Uncharacterized protein n=1 Tax=Clostridium botulinum D str. 1873 TaxID=592027 RepID=A0A9P2G628_CLOBO|nr:hypothetical protein CLG_B1070 [Clostridium botulinum D str. 1873]
MIIHNIIKIHNFKIHISKNKDEIMNFYLTILKNNDNTF